MAILLSCQAISKAYGAEALFENLSFGLFEGDRIGLVGPNGCGKSTLLKILAGLEAPDSGVRSLGRQVKLGYVPQDPVFPDGESITAILVDCLAGESIEDFDKPARVSKVLGKIGFTDPTQSPATLSGGWRKRLAIARELVRGPDLLLLDEPTNHLDLEGILWLERLLETEPLAYLVVSHDRYFLENVTNRMLELNRCYPGGFFDSPGAYSDFLEKKDEALRGQAQYQESLANKVRRELAWLKRGPKARTTKSQARIDQAERLMDELEVVKSRNTSRTARIELASSDRRTKRLLVAEQVGKSFGERKIIERLDLTLSPGTRLGLIGQNASGKTTLIRLLLGELEPDSGSITRADGLRIVCMDQDREQLDPALTLRRSLAPQGDQVMYRDSPIHVASWAKRFLFRTEQLEMPVGRMSGGEQARVLIAKLMLRPADLLILDEPTNDLDIPTLEVLEESLLDFNGAIVLVTHDRFLLDSVSTEILALDGQGRAERFADRRQWERARLRPVRQEASREAAVRPSGGAPSKPAGGGEKRLSYMEKREWEQMEDKILAAEQALEACARAANDPAIFTQPAIVEERFRELQVAQERVDRLYARWAELEEKQT